MCIYLRVCIGASISTICTTYVYIYINTYIYIHIYITLFYNFLYLTLFVCTYCHVCMSDSVNAFMRVLIGVCFVATSKSCRS